LQSEADIETMLQSILDGVESRRESMDDAAMEESLKELLAPAAPEVSTSELSARGSGASPQVITSKLSLGEKVPEAF
jgi:hypothetical protein